MPKGLSSTLRSHAELLFKSTTLTEEKMKSPAVNLQKVISREDVEMVLERMMMMSCVGTSSGSQFREYIAFDELVSMFEEKEPSLMEMRDAFGVFDENGDGFIDAVELQRILDMLGLREGVDVDACQRMIDMHDHNLDGRIDFHEFVEFMESSCFC
ncbi:putative EF-hand domain-containing protein [Dioscorea sansibarensis]